MQSSFQITVVYLKYDIAWKKMMMTISVNVRDCKKRKKK